MLDLEDKDGKQAQSLEDGGGEQVLDHEDGDGEQVQGLEDGGKQVLDLENRDGKQVWGLEDGQRVAGALFCAAELLAEGEGGDILGVRLSSGALVQQQRQCAFCKLLLLANRDLVLLPGFLHQCSS